MLSCFICTSSIKVNDDDSISRNIETAAAEAAAGETSNTWYTHDNGGLPFMVKAAGEKDSYVVSLSKLDAEKEGYDETKGACAGNYTLIKEYNNIEDVIVGKSPCIPMTLYSGGVGRAFDGNTVLLKVKSEDNTNCYIYIGDYIMEFHTPKPIIEYYSPVGNNDVSYPIALTDDDVCFMIHNTFISKKEFPVGYNWPQAYELYYRYEHTKPSAIRCRETKLIHERLL
jgi:hypothetical protein